MVFWSREIFKMYHLKVWLSSKTGILVLSPAEITKDMAHFLYLENDKIKSNTAKKTSENNKLHLWIDLFWLEIIVIFKTIY